MSDDRKIFGTWWNLLKSGPWCEKWLSAAVKKIFIRSDYFMPEFARFPGVEVVEGVLDRNEVLLIPKANPLLPISVSWSMPLTFVEVDLGLSMARGAANCLLCAHRNGSPDSFLCEDLSQRLHLSALKHRDAGCCTGFKLEAEYEFLAPPPVWWRDSDWPLASYRYNPAAFDQDLVADLITGRPVRTIRKEPIPPAAYEVELGIVRAPAVTKEMWLAFLEGVLDPGPMTTSILEMCRVRAFDAAGTGKGFTS